VTSAFTSLLNTAEMSALQALQPMLGVSLAAPGLLEDGWMKYFSNSIVVALIVTLAILFFVRGATKNMTLVPNGKQNFVEFVVEFLYNQVEQILGHKVAKRAFPLLATLFVYIVVSNWFGLIPGVGTMGLAEDYPLKAPLTLDHRDSHFLPILRPATGDMNMTLGIALTFMIVWFYITMKESGPVEFLKHTFGPKGGLTGFIKYALIPIFLFVGVIEIISIIFRPVSLSMRLFGNVFAGENLLHTMAEMGNAWGTIGSFLARIFLPLPFYFLELLVGLLQGMVFALLCAVYIKLSATHEEEH